MNPLQAAVAADPVITIRSYLTPGDERTLADDVLDGLTRPFKELPPKHFYDTRRRRAVRPHLRAARVLPDAHRARDPRRAVRAHRAGDARGRGRSSWEPAPPRRRASCSSALAAAGTLRSYVPVDVDRGDGRARRRRADDAVRRARGPRHRRRLRASSRDTSPRPATARGSSPSSVGRSATSRPDRAGASCARSRGCCAPASTICCSAPTSSRIRRSSRPPTTTARAITAAFNRNVLHVLNRELGADFDVDAFEHVAFFDREHEWIEMRLRASRRMRVHIAALDSTSSSRAREELRTEISAKFTPERLAADLAAAGLTLEQRADRRRRAVRPVARRRRPAESNSRPCDDPGRRNGCSAAGRPPWRTRARGRRRRAR